MVQTGRDPPGPRPSPRSDRSITTDEMPSPRPIKQGASQAIMAYCRRTEFMAEVKRERSAASAAKVGLRSALEQVEQRIKPLIDAILEGGRR